MLGPRLFCGELEGKLLSMVPTMEQHLPVCVRWLNDPEVARYLSLTFPLTEAQEVEWYERMRTDEHQVIWSIELSGEHIGQTGIHNIDWIARTGVTGMMIGDKRWWGKGVATTIMRHRSTYAFEQLNLAALFTAIYGPNEASRRAAQRVGYREYGRRPFAAFRGGVHLDEWLGVLSKDEWERIERERLPVKQPTRPSL